MSTRSIIGHKVGDKVESIYCHWDGYPTGNGSVGQTLNTYYKDPDVIKRLMKLGDLSSLGYRPVDNPNGWDYRIEHDATRCISYRSRGDTDTDAYISSSVEAFIEYATNSDVDYIYLFDNLTWNVLDDYGENFVSF